ncbi:MAG: mechanosensitive ion channel [Gammaproteobacteria bacterium]|nr:mechanosensitive ion channel [Gammaproteobacteria bacterium]
MGTWPWSWHEMGDVLSTASTWTQLALLAIAWGIAWAVNNFWADHVRWENDPDRVLRDLTFSTGMRLIQPFVFLMLVLMARAVMRKLDWDIDWLNIAVPLTLSYAGIRAIIFLLRKSLTPSKLLRAWEASISTVVWAVVALYMLGWWPPIESALDQVGMDIGHIRVSILSVFKVFIAIAIFFLLAVWLARTVEQRVEAMLRVDASMQAMIGKLIRVMFVLIAFIVILDALGIDLTALTVLGGAVGVGVGFGLQRIISNFISGFILLFDRAIKPGDVIALGDRNEYGWVKQLRARYVVVRQRDGVERLIPNEQLVINEVRNWTYSDPRVSINVPVQIGYQEDVEVVIKILEECATANSRVLVDPVPSVYVSKFGDSGIELSLVVWINDPQNGLGSVVSDLNLAIWRAFKHHGVSMPYPQRDVHVKMGDLAKIEKNTHT